MKKSYLAVRGMFLSLFFPHARVKRIDPAMVKSVLLIRIDRIGDLIVSLPAIEALKKLFPAARITLACRPGLAALAAAQPFIDEVLPYRGFFPFLAAMKSRRFSLAVDLLMDYTLPTAWLSLCSRAQVRAGFAGAQREVFFNFAVCPDTQPKSMAGYELDLVAGIARACGLQPPDVNLVRPQLRIRQEDNRYAADLLLKAAAGPGRMLIGCAPGGYYPSQRWESGYFAALADRLARKYNASIVIIGSAAEKALLEKTASRMQEKPVVVCGLGLEKLAALISRMDLLLCNNSGPLHIASALAVPTVSTMGPTVASLWQPQGVHQRVVSAGLSCSPCSRAVCRVHQCMSQISVEAMEEAAVSLVNEVNQAR